MGFFSSECVQGLVVAEVSNIFLIGRNLMKENNIESGKLYDIFVVGFMLVHSIENVWNFFLESTLDSRSFEAAVFKLIGHNSILDFLAMDAPNS